MTSKNEPAGVWVRVSSGGQDERNQVPEVERYCEAHGYREARRYELNDKSASKGEQQVKLDEMLDDMREGHIKVLVCWRSNRLERRGVEAVFKLLRQVKDAGSRIESVQEGQLNTGDVSGEALTSITAIMDHQYSVKLSQDVKLAHDRSRANGAVYTNVPWGFTIEGPKYNKRPVPTELCRAIVPQIFERCIEGDSLRTIAEWLDSEGIPSPKGNAHWSESTIRWTIRQRAYAGRLLSPQGMSIAKCEAVVPPDVFDRANQALNTRPSRGPMNENRPLLANLRCARCEDSPMYRVRIKGRTGKFYFYYRCTGRGAQRKGCGNMVPYDDLEEIVHAWITLVTDAPHQTREWIDGESYDNDISDVKQDIREVVETEQFDKLPELQAKLAELRDKQQHATQGHYERHDTGLTVGQYFHSLDHTGQREYLKTRDIRAEKVPERDGVPGVRLVIDGEDYGVIRLAQEDSRETVV